MIIVLAAVGVLILIIAGILIAAAVGSFGAAAVLSFVIAAIIGAAVLAVSLAIFLAVILAWPVQIRLSIARDGRSFARIRLFSGLIKLRFKGGSIAGKAMTGLFPAHIIVPPIVDKEDGLAEHSAAVIAALRARGAAALVWRLLVELTSAIEVDDGRLAVVIGLGDPALTGWLYGVIMMVRPRLRLGGDRFILEAYPDFGKFQITAHGELGLSTRPWRWASLQLMLLFSPSFWRMRAAYQRARRPSDSAAGSKANS